MLHKILGSSAQIALSLGELLKESIMTLATVEGEALGEIIAGDAKNAIPGEQSPIRRNEYSQVPDLKDNKLFNPEDLVIKQLHGLLKERKHFPILLKVAGCALDLESPPVTTKRAMRMRLEQLNDMEKILKKVKTMQCLYSKEVDSLCERIIHKRTALLSQPLDKPENHRISRRSR